MVVSDMDKYHRALEKALLAFHTAKMGDINKIVRELWQRTYRSASDLLTWLVRIACVRSLTLTRFAGVKTSTTSPSRQMRTVKGPTTTGDMASWPAVALPVCVAAVHLAIRSPSLWCAGWSCTVGARSWTCGAAAALARRC